MFNTHDDHGMGPDVYLVRTFMTPDGPHVVWERHRLLWAKMLLFYDERNGTEIISGKIRFLDAITGDMVLDNIP